MLTALLAPVVGLVLQRAGREKPPAPLQLPRELPGANVPPISLPPDTAPKAEREAALKKLFGELPPLPPDPAPRPGPDGRPYSLGDLQRLAVNPNPVVRQYA